MLAPVSLRRCLFLATLLAFACPHHALADQFVWGHPKPQGNGLYGLAFRDALHGWAVGGGGTVLATVDGGESWTLLQGPDLTTGDLNDIAALDDGALVAVGAGIRRSVDDGLSWTVVPSPAVGDLRDLTTVPGGGLSAAGEGGSVVRSFDGGLSWTEVGPLVGTVQHHLWRTADEGYAVGDDVSHRTTDGGQTWTQITDFTPFGFHEVYFTDALHGTIVEDFATWRTDDGGQTWTEFFAPVPPLYRFRTVVLSPLHLLTVTFIEGGELWETTDGGDTWTQLQNRFVTGFPSLVQTPGGRLVWASDVGDLFWSDDLGQTFTNAAENLCDSAPAAPITDFVRRPDGVLFAANQPSSSGMTESWLRSDDGGESWFVPAAVPGLRWINAGDFLDPDHGLVAYRSSLRLTDDGGDSWQMVELAADRGVASAALVAADRYFLATTSDAGGDLLRSVDGGLTWTPVAGGLPTGTFAAGLVRFVDADTGYVAGTLGATPRLYRTTDGGVTWQLRGAAGLPAQPRDLHWLDASTGIAAVYQSAAPGLYRTTNGGSSFTQVDATRSSAVVFRDALHGVALGAFSDGFRGTDDGGLSWTERDLPLRAPGPGIQVMSIEAVAPRPDGWVFGGSGNRILVATTGDVTSVADGAPSGRSPAAACRLLGTAPNPFNPATVISFELPSAGSVRITVHDLAGRRIRKLLDGRRESGRHAARWDGRDDAGAPVAAGVYLVRVTGPGGSDHLKMTLVK